VLGIGFDSGLVFVVYVHEDESVCCLKLSIGFWIWVSWKKYC